MYPIKRTILAAVAAAAIALPATALTTDKDVQCLLAASAFSAGEKDPAKKQLSVATLFFYLGRLDQQIAPAKLKAMIVAQGKTLNAQNAGGVMTACAQQVGVTQKMMQTIGQEMGANAPKPAPAPATPH